MNELKKTYGTFEAVGVFNVFGNTPEEKQANFAKMFTLNQTTQNNNVYSRFTVSLNCGDDRLSFAQLMGSENQGKEKGFYCHDANDFNISYRVAYDDRFNEDILSAVRKRDGIYVGLERSINSFGKGYTVGKLFLSTYEAINYIASNIKNGQVLKISGDLDYSIYNGKLSINKNIKYIALAYDKDGKIPTANNYYAKFNELLLFDINSCPKEEVDGYYTLKGYSNIAIKDKNLEKYEIVTVPREIYVKKSEIVDRDGNPNYLQSIVPNYILPKSPLNVSTIEIVGHYEFTKVETEEPNILELADPEKYPQFVDIITMYYDGLISDEELKARVITNDKSEERALFRTFGISKKDNITSLKIDRVQYTFSDLKIVDLSAYVKDTSKDTNQEMSSAFETKTVAHSSTFAKPTFGIKQESKVEQVDDEDFNAFFNNKI